MCPIYFQFTCIESHLVTWRRVLQTFKAWRARPSEAKLGREQQGVSLQASRSSRRLSPGRQAGPLVSLSARAT